MTGRALRVAMVAAIGIAISSPASGQADTSPRFVTFEHEGSNVATVHRASCGGVDYEIEQGPESWAMRRDGETVSPEVDVLLTRSLGYFDHVAFVDLDCGDFGGPGITEGMRFHVFKRFEDPEGPWLQIGVYSVDLRDDHVSHHAFSNITGSRQPTARVIEHAHPFLVERGYDDVPGVSSFALEAERRLEALAREAQRRLDANAGGSE